MATIPQSANPPIRAEWAGRTLRQSGTLLTMLIALVLIWLGSGLLVPGAFDPAVTRARSFITIFFGIFVEALPFLMAGVLVSSAIHLFITPERLQRIVPRQPFAAAVCGSLLGLAFPVCECGSVPAARSLMAKGAPLPLGIAFMLASPVINPIVIVSTFVAFNGVFGWQFVAWRVGLTIVVAVTVSLVLGVTKFPERILVVDALDEHNHDHDHNHNHDHNPDSSPATSGWLSALLGHAGDEFFEMSRYLVIGGALAAGLQTFIPPSLLLAVGQGPLLSVLLMMALAVVLSICSTVDAFVALSFVGAFAPGAILAFLVFGPMIDIKSTLMFTSTLQRRTVVLMTLLILQLVLLLALAVGPLL